VNVATAATRVAAISREQIECVLPAWPIGVGRSAIAIAIPFSLLLAVMQTSLAIVLSAVCINGVVLIRIHCERIVQVLVVGI
jgi:hypothetical protein